MKVCFVSKECAGLRGGGIGTYIAEAGKALRAHGHEAWLVTTLWDESERSKLANLPFDRVVLAGEGVPSNARRRMFHGDPHYGYSYLVHQTLQALGERFDYIEFADYEGEGLIPFQEQRLFGSYGTTVMGLMLHSPTWECFAYDGQAHRASLRIRETCNIEEEAIRLAPMINSPSQGLRDEVLNRLGLDRDVEIIRYPMELRTGEVLTTAPKQSLAELDILYFGRIEPRKGIEELVAAFHELPECRLRLIGGDVDYSPYGRSFREHCRRRAPANVEFKEPLPRPQLLDLIQHADVCIFPSRFENWPNTCIEAMAAGRVVIGSKHGGMGEMIEDGVSGFLVDGRSSADIVRVFRQDLAGSLGRLDKIGEAAAKRIRVFSEQRRYCDALQARVKQFAATMRPLPVVDHERHRVSVVMPFYRDRDTIDEAVDSALAQTHANLELLIVNDGSPLQDAEQILAHQCAKDPRVRVLNKPNGGLGSARNHGIANATGEFLLFCDADNVLRPEYARTGIEALVRHPESQFVAGHARFFEHKTDREVGIYNPMPFDRSAVLMTNRFGDAGAFFRRSVFLEHGIHYDEVLISYEDWALWMDLNGRGFDGERVPRELYNYRVRTDSMMQVDGLPNHPALMGWLIQNHLPNATQAERDLLTTLFQVAGQSIGRVSLGHHPDHLPQPRPATPPPQAPQAQAAPPIAPPPIQPAPERQPTPPEQAMGVQPPLPPPPLRHRVVDEMSRLSKKIPGFNWAMRSLLGVTSGLGRKLRNR
ncbi:MAG: glycosyltransferase [Planctomycetes bacterium]|nr:glycosyltransferase [Planctomycetota bacterium]